MTANVNRDPRRRRRPFAVSDFVPRDLAKEFRTPRGIGLTRGTLHALKPLFAKDGE